MAQEDLKSLCYSLPPNGIVRPYYYPSSCYVLTFFKLAKVLGSFLTKKSNLLPTPESVQLKLRSRIFSDPSNLFAFEHDPVKSYTRFSIGTLEDRASGFRAVDLGEEEVVSETQETTPTNLEDIDDDMGVNPSPEIVGGKDEHKLKERQLQCEIDLMKKVQTKIDALPGITFEEAFEATDVIGKCPFKAELLFGYDQGKKIKMVQMVSRKST
ncbi:hypothetical protein Tco_1093761 [Tanacetum coccineum]|uniref:Uncharacterized protein n=1 Tax=Tanacetum coccineum TaxID=301880 RepID=A0ABQ5IFX7_9ASTR